MLEDVNRAASRDEAALGQVQQTAARGEAQVQGRLLSRHFLAASQPASQLASQPASQVPVKLPVKLADAYAMFMHEHAN